MPRYELVDGSSSKFWEITLQGSSYTVTYGRIGTKGQTKTKDFDTDAAATAAHDKVVKSKTKKGYQLVGTPAASAPSPAPAPTPAASEPVAKEAPPAPQPPPAEPVASDAFDALWPLALPDRARGLGTAEHLLDSQWIERHVAAVRKRVEADPAGTVDALFANELQLRNVVGATAILDALQNVDDPTYEVARAKLQARLDHGVANWNQADAREPAAMAAIALGSSKGALQLLDCITEHPGTEPDGWYHSPIATAMSFVDDPTRLGEVFARKASRLVHLDPITLCTRVGPTAIPYLMAAAEQVLAKRKQLDTERADAFLHRVHTLVAHAPTAEGVRMLLQHGESRAVTHLWKGVWTQRPDLLLGECLARMARTDRHTIAHDLARRVLRIDPSLAALARTDTEKGLVAAIPAAGSAAPSSLPSVLATPPWKGVKVPKVATIDGLVAPARPESLVWPAGLREAWSLDRNEQDNRSSWARGYLTGNRKGSSNDDDVLVQHYATYVHALEGWKREYFRSEALECLCVQPPALAVRLLHITHPCFWSISGRLAQQLVARVGLDALPTFLVRAGLQDAPDPTFGAPQKVSALGPTLAAALPLRSVRLVPLVAEGLAGKQGNKDARRWVRAHPETAAVGLVPLALGKAAKPARGARLGLRLLVAEGHRDTVEAAAAAHGEAVRDAITTLLDASPYALKRAPKTPAWLPVDQLEPVRLLDGTPIGPAAQEVLVGMLAASTVDAPYPALAGVVAACDPASLAAFAWSLTRAWAWEGGPSKDRWAFTALAHLADDDVVRRLAALMALWPSDGLSARAKVGVEVLGAVGGDAALLALYQFSEKAKTKGLKSAATVKMHELAAALGLSADELADRLVPDLGLDERGTLDLDLGDRVLTVGFDEHLQPYVIDEDGKRMDKFPRAKATTDKAKLKEARSAFKALQKEAKKVGEHVIQRFEGAMATGRSWPLDIAQSCFFDHPLMRHLSNRVAWVATDAKGRSTVFRVAEDATFTTADDEPVELPDDTTVTLLHPLRTDADTVAAMAELFADYEVLQPFEQLARPTFALSDGEGGDTLTRFDGVKIPTKRIFSLEKHGWTRSLGQNTKRLSTGSVTVHYRPGIDGGPHADRSGEQTLGQVQLSGTTLDQLDAVTVSELLYDLERLQETR